MWNSRKYFWAVKLSDTSFWMQLAFNLQDYQSSSVVYWNGKFCTADKRKIHWCSSRCLILFLLTIWKITMPPEMNLCAQGCLGVFWYDDCLFCGKYLAIWTLRNVKWWMSVDFNTHLTQTHPLGAQRGTGRQNNCTLFTLTIRGSYAQILDGIFFIFIFFSGLSALQDILECCSQQWLSCCDGKPLH